MKPHAILFASIALCAGNALAQATATPSGETPSGATSIQGPTTAGPAISAGVAPPAPPVQALPTPAVETDIAGQPGFFRPPPESVVVSPFPPATTPGVTPIETPTAATVGASASDRALRDSVAAALAADPELQGAAINVLVRDGVVTLGGTAEDGAQAERAREVTERIAGSSRVSAGISVPR
jgi:hypothetical protein